MHQAAFFSLVFRLLRGRLARSIVSFVVTSNTKSLKALTLAMTLCEERDNGTNLRGMNNFMSMIIAMILLTNPIAIRNF